jgi:hypothetical protein
VDAVRSRGLLAEAWAALGGAAGLTGAVRLTGPPVVLGSRLPVTALAQATAAAAGLAAAELASVRCGAGPPPAVLVDSRAAAVAFRGESHLRVDGERPGGGSRLSRFLPATDSWIRLHGTYPHHRSRLLEALGLVPDALDPLAAVAEAVALRSPGDLEEAIVALGGVAAAVRTRAAWRAHPHGEAVAALPLLTLTPTCAGPPRPLPPLTGEPLLPAAGLRVLDLTRVIAGPVATRTLALLGADVLRVDSPRLPELAAHHLDTGLGKRSTLLDLSRPRDRRTFEGLLRRADVVVLGYRRGALDRFGLDPDGLLRRHPGLVVATLSAWGSSGPWAGRRGFDSLVQAASGIARVEAGGRPEPGVLPAQALDHGTGYLLAGAVLRAVARRAVEGGGWRADLSLAQTAAWLLRAGTEPVGAEEPAPLDPEPWLATVDTPAGRVTHALPAFAVAGGPRTWATPAVAWGTSAPAWLD